MNDLEYFRNYSNIRFVRIKGKTKLALDQGWNKYENGLTFKEIKEYVKNTGANYGILCAKDLIVIDLDNPAYCIKNGDETKWVKIGLDKQDYLKEVTNKLPPTLIVETQSKARHFYFFCEDFNKMVLNKEVFIDGEYREVHYGEIQAQAKSGAGTQVIGPGSVFGETNGEYKIIENKPIAKISKFDLFGVFEEFFNKKEKNSPKELLNFDDIDSLRVDRIFNTSGLTRVGNELRGPHPIHSSTGGMNFSINTATNSWFFLLNRVK